MAENPSETPDDHRLSPSPPLGPDPGGTPTSRESYRAIFDAVGEAIAIHDPETGAVLDVNRAAEEIFRLPRERLLRMTVADLSDGDPPYSAEDAAARLEQAAADTPQIFTWRSRRGDGELFSSEVHLRRVRMHGEDRIVAVVRDLEEARRTREALASSEARYRTLFESAAEAVFLMNDRVFLDCNRSAVDAFGGPREDILGRSPVHVSPPTQPDGRPSAEKAAEKIRAAMEGTPQLFEWQHRRLDGTLFDTEVNLNRVELPSGPHLLASVRDISARKRAESVREELEAQLRQAQKMEAVGRLAGGVAHDFNNKLQGILGFAELILSDRDLPEHLTEGLEEIRKAAEQSAGLTRQLLGFARKQTVSPRALDLNDAVAATLTMLRRLIGEDIELTWLPGAELWSVRMDPSQLDQILANLSLNARDAIDGVGSITIETENLHTDEAYCAGRPGFVPGDYVRLAVSDDGCGMDAEIVPHLFEPFFTTKRGDQGTGLGLATVYGIVKQNNGYINVYSEPGQGTTFSIYLPRHRGPTERPAGQEAGETDPQGRETILFVEDEAAILKLGKRLLERLGYRVLTAATPGEAIELAERQRSPIHLLITDVVMPEMNGRELAKRLLSVHPSMKRLFISGYTANVIAHHGVLDEGMPFLQKPFSRQELGSKVREVLDRQ